MTTSPHGGLKAAAIPATINAVINGFIAYNTHGGRDAVPVTVDAISSAEATVGSEAAMIALTLAVILTTITAVITRKGVQRRHPEERLAPWFPTVPLIALQNALMMFGATVVGAVLWQRLVGTVTVSPPVAALLVALFAALATVFVHVRTTRLLTREP